MGASSVRVPPRPPRVPGLARRRSNVSIRCSAITGPDHSTPSSATCSSEPLRYSSGPAHGTRMLDREASRSLRAHHHRSVQPALRLPDTLFSPPRRSCSPVRRSARRAQDPEVLGYVDLFTASIQPREPTWRASSRRDHAAPTVRGVDPEPALALLDQRQAGKKLILITTSEGDTPPAMMSYRVSIASSGRHDLRSLSTSSSVALASPVLSSKSPLFEW